MAGTELGSRLIREQKKKGLRSIWPSERDINKITPLMSVLL